MRIWAGLIAIFLVATMSTGDEAKAQSHRDGQLIGVTQTDARPCTFFMLQGVTEADPTTPGQPWFAIPASNPNYQVMVSVLLAAKTAHAPISVYTDGTISCGYATASMLGMD